MSPARVAVVLAAGRGERLGGPKAALDLGGRSALQRCIDALRDGGVDEVRAVLAAGAAPAAVRGARLVVNAHPERGQTSSLKAGLLGGLGGAGCLVLHTVDRPLVEAEDVAALLDAFDRRAPGIEIVVPSVDGRRGHPAVFAPGPAEELAALGDAEPAHAVVRRRPRRVAHVVMARPWLVRDIDTPADLAAARAALAGR